MYLNHEKILKKSTSMLYFKYFGKSIIKVFKTPKKYLNTRIRISRIRVLNNTAANHNPKNVVICAHSDHFCCFFSR